ncbi:hypothetical protein TNCV_826111 [Trichonephila clavipes]|nr:hypothetical protein TNCV_826111 [Trichonephila clavipes]
MGAVSLGTTLTSIILASKLRLIRKLELKEAWWKQDESRVIATPYLEKTTTTSLFGKWVKQIEVKVDQVWIYHPRERDEGVVDTEGLDSNESRAAHRE